MTEDDRESTQMALAEDVRCSLDRKTQGGRDLRSNSGYESGSGSGDSHDEEDGDREVVVRQTQVAIGMGGNCSSPDIPLIRDL